MKLRLNNKLHYVTLALGLALWLAGYGLLPGVQAHLERQQALRDIGQSLRATALALLEQGGPGSFQHGLLVEEVFGRLMVRQPLVELLLQVDAQQRIQFALARPLGPLAESIGPRGLSSIALRGVDLEAFLDRIRSMPGSFDTVRFSTSGNHQVDWIALVPAREGGLFQWPDSGMGWLIFVFPVIIFGALLFVEYIKNDIRGRALRKYEEDLREARESATLGTLGAGLAHELGNPLNAMGFQLDLLEEDLGQGDASGAGDRIQRIRDGIAYLDRAKRQFLMFARPDRAQPRRLELKTAVTQSLRDLEDACRKHAVQIDMQVPEGLLIWMDAETVRQLVLNLVMNAVNIQAAAGIAEPRVQVSAALAGPAVELVVEDAGPGVAPEARDRIFECFYSTQVDGTGMGLPIARRLLHLNGGDLMLDEQPSALGGARFVARLPVPPESGSA